MAASASRGVTIELAAVLLLPLPELLPLPVDETDRPDASGSPGLVAAVCETGVGAGGANAGPGEGEAVTPPGWLFALILT